MNLRVGQAAPATWGTTWPSDAQVYDPAWGATDLFGDGSRYVYQGFAVYGLRYYPSGVPGWAIVWSEIQASRSQDWVRERFDQRLALNHEWLSSGGNAYAATWYWATPGEWRHLHTLVSADELLAWGSG